MLDVRRLEHKRDFSIALIILLRSNWKDQEFTSAES